MIALPLLLLILAFVFFLLAAILPYAWPAGNRLNLVALGLAAWVLSILLGSH